jgi:hypothetical protein
MASWSSSGHRQFPHLEAADGVRDPKGDVDRLLAVHQGRHQRQQFGVAAFERAEDERLRSEDRPCLRFTHALTDRERLGNRLLGGPEPARHGGGEGIDDP